MCATKLIRSRGKNIYKNKNEKVYFNDFQYYILLFEASAPNGVDNRDLFD